METSGRNREQAKIDVFLENITTLAILTTLGGFSSIMLVYYFDRGFTKKFSEIEKITSDIKNQNYSPSKNLPQVEDELDNVKLSLHLMASELEQTQERLIKDEKLKGIGELSARCRWSEFLYDEQHGVSW